MLDQLFGNKTVQNMALGKLKSVMKENKLQAVIVRLDENDEFAFALEKEPGKWIPENELQTYQENTLRLVELEQENSRLNAMNIEFNTQPVKNDPHKNP